MMPNIPNVPHTLHPRLPQDNMNVRVWNLECALLFLYFPVTRFMSNIYRFFWVLWSLIRELMNLNIVFTIVQMRKIVMNGASYMLQDTKNYWGMDFLTILMTIWKSMRIFFNLMICDGLLSPYVLYISNWYSFKAH